MIIEAGFSFLIIPSVHFKVYLKLIFKFESSKLIKLNLNWMVKRRNMADIHLI